METDQVLDAIKKLDARRLHEEPDEENTMEHPEEIYKDINGKEMSESERLWGDGMNRRRAYDLGHEAGYAKCLADTADPLEGYSNLTEAISAGEPIDYEKLDGLVAKCVHPTLGNLLYPLEVDGNGRKVIWNSEGNFWFTTNGGKVWAEALREAWDGQNGWTLYVEGEIPLRRKTADQLEPGTGFLGQWRSSDEPELMVLVVLVEFPGERTYRRVKPMVSPAGYFRPEHVEVIEEYGIGTFQKPEGK